MSQLNNLFSTMVSVTRLGRGWYVFDHRTRQPEQVLELYEFENCPYCRKARESLSELDLEYISRSSARGSRKREQTPTIRGRKYFPYLVDANTGHSMPESEDIIEYLYKTYGGGSPPLPRWLSPVNSVGSGLASGWRVGRGRKVKAGLEGREQPKELLVLYNFEASPYCRKVREVLNELNLDCHIKNVAKRSPRRSELIKRGGKMQVPYLIDPNTNTEMYESDDIIAYLEKTYGLSLRSSI
jgi:glutathione S-transferase